MKKTDAGFLLADVIIATGMVAVIGLAASQAIAGAERQRRRLSQERTLADCAERLLARTLAGPSLAAPTCGGGLTGEETVRRLDASWEEVTLALRADRAPDEIFTTIRYAP